MINYRGIEITINGDGTYTIDGAQFAKFGVLIKTANFGNAMSAMAYADVLLKRSVPQDRVGNIA